MLSNCFEIIWVVPEWQFLRTWFSFVDEERVHIDCFMSVVVVVIPWRVVIGITVVCMTIPVMISAALVGSNCAGIALILLIQLVKLFLRLTSTSSKASAGVEVASTSEASSHEASSCVAPTRVTPSIASVRTLRESSTKISVEKAVASASASPVLGVSRAVLLKRWAP